jgi:hypothetical protein
MGVYAFFQAYIGHNQQHTTHCSCTTSTGVEVDGNKQIDGNHGEAKTQMSLYTCLKDIGRLLTVRWLK